jgi:carbamoyl-phosphate synthase/aspartate carbamoyltransferase/dihydroorotase
MTHVQIPGLVDVHVHLRHPGGEHKETVESGTAAALAGGVTALLAMPNTSPPLIDGLRLAAARSEHSRRALCDVGLLVGAAVTNARAAAACAPHAAGLKVYVNDTFGPLRLETLAPLAEHFSAWPRGKPIVVHAEDLSLGATIGLAAAHGQRLHVAHVSKAAEIALIVAAKEAGLAVTCEVTPHHLFLTAEDAERLGPYGQVRPELGTAADRDALWRNLGAVDCIASDHAPHARQEKDGANPPPGVPGLETMLPLMLTAVADERLTLDRLVELTSITPARLFGVGTPAESAVEVEIGPGWTLPASGYQTKCDWTPFAGMPVKGRVTRTALRGALVWVDGMLRASPGTGRMLF